MRLRVEKQILVALLIILACLALFAGVKHFSVQQSSVSAGDLGGGSPTPQWEVLPTEYAYTILGEGGQYWAVDDGGKKLWITNDKTELFNNAIATMTSGGAIFSSEVEVPAGLSYGNTVIIVESYQGAFRVYSNQGKGFLLTKLVYDPDTTGWTSTQAGYWWLNTADGKIKFWDGSTLQVLPSVAGSVEITLPYTWIIYQSGSTHYAEASNGSVYYSSTNASFTFISALSTMTSTGGAIYVMKGVYDLDTKISIVGTGTPSLGTGVASKSWAFKGEAMWSTVLRATSAHSIFEFSNALSIDITNLYLDQNGYDGYPIRGLATGTSVRSLMRSSFSNLEIHGVNSGYYGIFAENAYFINTWSQIYIRTSGGGMLFESTATGYGNQHFENIMISLGGTSSIALRLHDNGAPYGENSFDRILIDGGDSSTPTNNLGVELDGSNYNTFTYLKIEHIKEGVRMGATTATHGNTILSGYVFLNETGAKVFNLGSLARWNNIQDVIVASTTTYGNAIMIYDNNTDINRPNSYRDIQGYSTGFAGVGSYIVRADSDASRLYGQMLWRKAQNTIESANFRINATTTSMNMTISHALCLTPESYYVTIEETTAVYDWDAHVIEVFNANATTIIVRLAVTTASATNPSYAHLVFYGDVNG